MGALLHGTRTLVSPQLEAQLHALRHAARAQVHNALFQLEGIQFMNGQPFDGDTKAPMEVPKDAQWLKMASTADIVVFNTAHHWHR